MTVRSSIEASPRTGQQTIAPRTGGGGTTISGGTRGGSVRQESAVPNNEYSPEVEQGTYWGGGGGGGESYQSDLSATLDQIASNDTGDLVMQAQSETPAQTAQPVQQQNTQQQPTAPSVTAQSSGYSGIQPVAPTQQNGRGAKIDARIPMIDVSSIGSMEAMSSRRESTPTDAQNFLYSLHEELSKGEEELAESLANGDGVSNVYDPVPTARAMETRDRQIIENRMAVDARAEVEAVIEAAENPTGRPDSIFNRPVGYSPKSRAIRTVQPTMGRFRKAIESAKAAAKSMFKGAGRGYRIYGKMNGLPSLRFREVGVGMQEIIASATQNPEMLDRLLGMEEGQSVGMMSATELADYINERNILVATFKPPSNRGQDVQGRILRVLKNEQRGIYIHPVMAAMYTADFDGDDMEVSFDPDVIKSTIDPMEGLIGIDGKQSLNLDFLKVAKIEDGWDEGKSARDYVLDIMLSKVISRYRMDKRTLRQLVDSIVYLGKQADNDNKKATAWSRVFREARKVSDRLSDGGRWRSNALMSDLCQSVYDGMNFLATNRALLAGKIVRPENLPDPKIYDDKAFYELAEGMVSGKVPNNFQDLKKMLTAFTGNVKGKNAPFRFTADVGKMVKMDSRLRVGDGFEVDPNSNEQMAAFFESTVKYAYSLRMAKEIKKAGRSQYYTRMLSERVISEVGFPDSVIGDRPMYASYHDFLEAFCESYNRNSAMVNEANLVMLSSGEISSDSNRGTVSPIKKRFNSSDFALGDIAEPMLSVYGNYSVRRMFGLLESSGVTRGSVDERWKGKPGHVTELRKGRGDASKAYEREYEASSNEFWITNKYMTYTLRSFAHENRLVRDKQFRDKVTSETLGSLDEMNDVSSQFDMLMAIADKGTSRASAFNTSVYGSSNKYDGTTVQMMSDLLVDMKKLESMHERRDQMRWIEDSVATLYMSGPDMFSYFNMDSPAGFLQSDWAKKMLEYAGNFDVIGGIRAAMVFEYRMERVTALSKELAETVGTDRFEDTFNNLKFAKDELAASSEVWHGIIREFEAEETSGMQSVFQQMVSKRELTQTSVSGEEYVWNPTYNAATFWHTDNGRHPTLRSVIEDLDLGWETKQNVIADVVRYWEHDFYLNSYEVGFQLEVGNDSTYSLESGAQKGALSVHRDFEQAFNRWGKMSLERMQENISEASSRHRSKKGNLLKTLERLDSCPWELIAIDDHMYADSIMAVYDKTYAQSEKASQHPWTNAIYSAVSFQRNGGFYNDVYRTDDRMLGLTNVNNIGVHDIIHILADPEAMMWVYNEYGEMGIITRDIILMNGLRKNELSEDIESEIWEFLEQEPMIAAAIRRHNACVTADTDGSGYIGALLSTEETIDSSVNGAASPIDHIKYLMRDHPTYASIISMATPAYGAVTRNARERIVATENYLCGQLYTYAAMNISATQAATEILEDLGITTDSLRDALKSDYDKYLDSLGITRASEGVLESDAEADGIYEVARDRLIGYIVNEIRPNVNFSSNRVKLAERPEHVGIDVSSVASFWDVMQELGGAKTSVSTGVEGAETFQLGEWASHVTAKDSYADLEAIEDEDISPEWNGAWTSLVYEGEPVPLSVSDDGKPFFMIEGEELSVFEAKQRCGLGSEGEVVVRAPSSYTVRDKSTDSHGTPVSSKNTYLVCKRSKGAEEFNLKAKKSGLDAFDSISKMQGRFKMEQGENGTMVPVDFLRIRYELQTIAQQNGENGLMAARLKLAQMMLEENNLLGYDDLTLSNYMNIAELMFVKGDDGEYYLRSLEMLFSAIKHRLGARIDGLGDDEIRVAADAIVNDMSENGVGMAMMSSLDAFNKFRPKSKSSQVSGIKQNSSIYERNYDLLDKITLAAFEDGIDPLSVTDVEKLHGEALSVKEVSDMVRRTRVTRNFNIVGYAGMNSVEDSLAWNIGPSSAIFIGGRELNDNEMDQICNKAYKLGMTLIVSGANRSGIPKSMAKDCMPCGDSGDVLVPCFDMRLNGCESAPYNGGQFAIFQAPFSRYVVSVEDSINEYELGDAQYKPTKALTDRVKVIDSGSTSISAESLFPNVFKNPAFRHCDFSVSLASQSEIAQQIVDGVRCTIDYGIVEGGKGFDQRVRDVNNAIDRYQKRWSEANPDGMLMGDMVECEPGDIVAWAEVEIHDQLTDQRSYVLAPIIPFPLHGSTKNLPEKFSVQGVSQVDNDGLTWAVNWSNTSDLANSNAKYFDSSGGANKGMIDFTDTINDDLMLRDGTRVDAYCAKASTDSRKIGTDKRVKTMISLMALARMHGYNFAKSDGTFPQSADHPENDEIRERLPKERISTAEWNAWLTSGEMLFTTDPTVNAFLNWECHKVLENGGNPSDYLANVYEAEDGTEYNTHVMWEFEAMFDQGIRYEDGLLKFLHAMDPTLCPNGTDDQSECLFRLYRDGDGIARDYDVGVLQMQVPHRLANGSVSYIWDNVYIGMSFFGEDYSGFSRPNVDGASNFLDAMNTMSYYGARLSDSSEHLRALWASADIGRLPHDGGALGRA